MMAQIKSPAKVSSSRIIDRNAREPNNLMMGLESASSHTYARALANDDLIFDFKRVVHC